MKTIAILLAVLLSACVDFEPGSTFGSGVTVDDPIDVADTDLDATIDGIPDGPAPCVAPECRGLIAVDSYYSQTRFVGGMPSGIPWDSDGSLPEPVMEIRVNGVLVGATVTEPVISPFPRDTWRARWRETVATVELHVDDKISMDVIDAEEHYPISHCEIRATAVYLATYHEINCLQADGIQAGSITVGIGEQP